ncbi:hypothetical protein BSPWISOXPB_6480 [uncultured Gammaproteobacteria bacterium]|nr:hypothetical protein BSPWISOXPB_6480 [uncultured Gammaproteobacteria bacterium]
MARYRQELSLKAVLAVKQVNTTIPIKAHKKYSYKLQGLILVMLTMYGALTLLHQNRRRYGLYGSNH